MLSTSLTESAPPPSFPAVTLSVLPPELLHRILKFAIESNGQIIIDSDINRGVYGQRCRFLLRASLVCRSLRSEANVLLWRELTIENEARALAVMKSPVFGRYQTHVLCVEGSWGTEGVEVDSLFGMLKGVQGIRELELNGFMEKARLSFEFLAIGNLSNLTTLTLSNVSIYESEYPIPLHQLNLTTLKLINYVSKSTLGYFPFPLPNLTHLTLRLSALLAHRHHNKRDVFFQTIGAQLVSLEVSRMISSLIGSSFILFTNLQHLDIGFYPTQISKTLNLLPS